MADLVIRGMEIPEYCYECPCHNGESGYCQAYKSGYLYSIERPAKCPLIPLPEGHGRLIDASEAYDKISEQECGYYMDMDGVGAGLEECRTIVPAEGGSDNV